MIAVLKGGYLSKIKMQSSDFNFLGVSLWAFRWRSCPQGRRATG
ncbi:MAG: hypothetical protein RML94_12610 [Bacteroidia bacterium]|nr:hypothetical protein [Bacteroidia bacterium]